jgi:polyisoprenyl-phosphate glycosyltransferase
MSLSIVVTGFNEEAPLPELQRRATRAAEDIVSQDFELVLVNDGSRYRTWKMMQALASEDPRIAAVSLSQHR